MKQIEYKIYKIIREKGETRMTEVMVSFMTGLTITKPWQSID